MVDDMRMALVGGGKMGEALVRGLLNAAVLEPSEITVSDVAPERRAALAEGYGVAATGDSAAAVTGADVVVLAVKPQQIDAVLNELSGIIVAGQLVLSIAAGVSTAKISDYLVEGVAVVRAMPNTAAQVGEAMTALSPGPFAGDVELATAQELLQAIGEVVVVDEGLQNPAVAINGSGPAYFYLFVQMLIEAGVRHGLGSDDAATLTIQTMKGAAAMLAETGRAPQALIDEVASPGGTTVAALEAFELAGLRGAVFAAVDAATQRAGELG